MKKIAINIAIISLAICAIELKAEPYSSKTEDDWCKNLALNPECSNTNNLTLGIEAKGLMENSLQHKGISMKSSNSVWVRFYPNSAKITKVPQDLDSLGRALRNATSNVVVVVEGHTDSIGSDKYNMSLSKRRAQVVRNYLIKNYDILPQRLRAIGRGEKEPIDNNDSEYGRSMNRRVVFRRL